MCHADGEIIADATASIAGNVRINLNSNIDL
jgi:hypothetical protein